MPESSWCWDLTEGATISINVFLINAITNAIHACTCHVDILHALKDVDSYDVQAVA
ncbi:hypothetical protein ACLB1O_29745 [Escherichia coli]